MPHTQTFRTSAGVLHIVATARGVAQLAIGDDTNDDGTDSTAAPSTLAPWVEEIERRLHGLEPSVDVPLDLTGTPFQRRVWAELQQIPRGSRCSYQDVAARLGVPTAARAVAGACAANRVAILIPCHRVVRGNGALGGYRWGVALKQRLLDDESQAR